ncbi:MAG: InlB B-repeat-containing protein [Treponema sp.]|nr:InlB B-repeat-containing protein [Treponema sp.]
MKTKKTGTKQAGFFVLLGIWAMLCAFACDNLLEPPNQRKAQTGAQETGMGTFTLNVADTAPQGRTIIPQITNGQFAEYRLIFTGGPEVITEFRTFAGLTSNPIELPAISYALEVFAYTSVSPANRDVSHKPAARGTSSVTVVAGQNISGDITLTAYRVTTDFGGEGTFNWNISCPTANTVSMSITPFDTNNTNTYNPSVANNIDGSVTLPVGYYRVTITLTQTGKRTVVWRETLHIYQNMTSHYTKTFGEEYFAKASFVITFMADGMVYADPSYFYDDNSVAAPAVNPSKAGHIFRGWYSDNDTFANPWTFGVALPGDTTVYAWFQLPYVVSYRHGANTLFTENYFYDQSVVRPSDPAPLTGPARTFRNWYTDDTLATLYSFGSTLTGDISVYAWFQENLTGTVEIEIDDEDGAFGTVKIKSLTGLNAGINAEDPSKLVYRWLWNTVEQTVGPSDVYVIPSNQTGGNFRLEISHPDYFGFIFDQKGMPLRGETEDNPLLVNSLAALRLVGSGDFAAGGFWTKNAFYRQTANITVTGTAWTPVSQRGGNTNPFVGNYNGDGFLIININWTSDSSLNDLSLFGTIGTAGVVTNIIADSPRITGRDRLGVIASVNNGTIRRSVANNSNVNGGNSIGGIAGENAGLIENCYTTGVVFGHGAAAEGMRVGGIVGLNTGEVRSCYSTSTITGDSFVGGIVGQNNTGATVINCVALNPNITSRTVDAGRIGAGSGTFTNNRTRGDDLTTNPATTYSIRITGGGNRTGNDGTSTALNTNQTTLFITNSAWTTANWIIPTNTLTVGSALPSLVMPSPRLSPVPTLPAVRRRTTPNNATFNVDVRNFITFDRVGREGWWAKPVEGEWVVGEMLEGRPSGPVTVPQNVINQINSTPAHTVAGSTTIRSYNIPDGTPGVPNVGRIRMWGMTPTSGDGRIEFEFELNFPVIRAEIVFRVLVGGALYNPTHQVYFCTRDNIMKTGWPYSVENGSIITGILYGAAYASQNNGITQFNNAGGNFTMQVDIFVETYGDWTYLPDNDVNISDPFVIFRVDDSEGDDNDYYWFDAETQQGQSSATGATDIFSGFEEIEVNVKYVPYFNPPPLSEFQKTGGSASQPIRDTLWVRTTMDDPKSVFMPNVEGPDRDSDGINYAGPRTQDRVGVANANRITPNIVLVESGEIVGRAEIILIAATTTDNTAVTGGTYLFDLVTSPRPPVVIDIVLHLNENYASDVTSIQLRGISNLNITPVGFTVDRNANNYTTITGTTVRLSNTTNDQTHIARFNRITGSPATGGLEFRFNY